MQRHPVSYLALACAVAATTAGAQVPEDCRTPVFSDVGWTDITATTAMADLLLSNIGYEPEIRVLSVPVTFNGLAEGDVDVFLGNWMPLEEDIQQEYLSRDAIEVVTANLEGARVGLATTAAAAENGLQSYEDIKAFEEELNGQIYGIEAGSSANGTIIDMTETGKFGLGDFDIVESSEQGMLAQVGNAAEDGEPIVFFGWRPHPMNVTLDMTYLSGGGDTFGPNNGSAKVNTVTRPGLSEECPNLGAFLENLVFQVEAEDVMMKYILNDDMEADEAVRRWLEDNPQAIDRWMDGVTTVEGEPAAPAVRSALGLTG